MEVAITLGLEVLLLAVLAVAAYTDLRWLMVPNWAVMPALALSLAAVLFLPDWPGRLLAGLALGGLLFSLTFTGLGMGDVKLGGLLGLVLGFQAGASALFLAGLTCGLVGLALLAARRVQRKTLLPFAPFLGLGVVTVLAGQAMGVVWF